MAYPGHQVARPKTIYFDLCRIPNVFRVDGDTPDHSMKGLILAQSERWRRGLDMQVERKGPFGGTRAANGRVIPGQPTRESGIATGNGG